jgi:hypothetical protein
MELNMTEWVYKATRVRGSYADARDLAVNYHFLCRSIFAHGPASQSARELEMVADVALGDVIHYYYRTPEARVRCLGSFRVVHASTFSGLFEACAGRGAAVGVLDTPENRKMLGCLRRGYSPDPKLAVFTGWAVERLPIDSGTPGFDQARMFPSLTTALWRYPDPSLPRARVDSSSRLVDG